ALGGDRGEASDVALRVRQAGHHFGPDGVADRSHHNWDGLRRPFRGYCGGRTPRHNYVNFEGDELGRELREPFEASFSVKILEAKVLYLGVAEMPEALTQRVNRWQCVCRQHADCGRLSGPLRFYIEQRKREAECENDRKTDPPHRHPGWEGWRESSRRWLSAGVGRVGRARY